MLLLRPRWRKVIRDLWMNKGRTTLVVLSIAVGVFAVGTILNSRTALSDSLAQTYAATNPAHATILTLTPFDEDLLKTVRNMNTVEDADARRSVTVRLQTGPNEWINIKAIESITRIGGKGTLDLLMPELVDPNENIRIAAVNALGALKDRRALPVLNELAAKRDDREVSKLARQAIAAIHATS